MYFKYIALSLLPIFILKLLILPSSLSDALIIMALAAVYAWSYHLENKKEAPINEAVKKELTSVKEEIKEIKSTLTAFKLSSQIRLK